MEQFAASLVDLSLSVHHHCDDKFDLCLNGHRLAILIMRLSHLRSLHFSINVQLKTRHESSLMNDFTNSFRTPFWLNGPLGCITVSVDFDQTHGIIHMLSLPFTFRIKSILRTLDLLDVQLNTIEGNRLTPTDLCGLLKQFWHSAPKVVLHFEKNQYIPVSFLQSLQIDNKHGELNSFTLTATRDSLSI